MFGWILNLIYNLLFWLNFLMLLMWSEDVVVFVLMCMFKLEMVSFGKLYSFIVLIIFLLFISFFINFIK